MSRCSAAQAALEVVLLSFKGDQLDLAGDKAPAWRAGHAPILPPPRSLACPAAAPVAPRLLCRPGSGGINCQKKLNRESEGGNGKTLLKTAYFSKKLRSVCPQFLIFTCLKEAHEAQNKPKTDP